MIDIKDCTHIGSCVKMHGIKGEFIIRLESDIELEALESAFLHFEIDGGLVPFKITSIRSKKTTDILVALEDTQDESRCQQLINSSVFIETKYLSSVPGPELDYHIYIDWKAIDSEKGELGLIADVIEIANNPLFVVNYKKSELLIPINEDLIDGIDEQSKGDTFQTPGGTSVCQRLAKATLDPQIH